MLFGAGISRLGAQSEPSACLIVCQLCTSLVVSQRVASRYSRCFPILDYYVMNRVWPKTLTPRAPGGGLRTGNSGVKQSQPCLSVISRNGLAVEPYRAGEMPLTPV